MTQLIKTTSKIKRISSSVNDICFYHERNSWDFLRKNILKRSDPENVIINKNVSIFFDNTQMIVFYGKYKLLLDKLYLEIRNILVQVLQIDIHPFCLIIYSYLAPSYKTFYIQFPNIIKTTFFNSRANKSIQQITIFIIKRLILEYKDILKFCPILYDSIVLILTEYFSIRRSAEKKTFYLSIIKENEPDIHLEQTIHKERLCICNAIVNYIVISVTNTIFEKEQKDMNLVRENLSENIEDILKMFITKYY